MTRLAKVGLVAMLCLGPLAATRPAAAAPALPSPAERRAALRPAYEALAADARYLELRDEAGRSSDRGALDRLLAYMSISPLDFLEIDMMARTYDMVVPQSVFEQHERWLTLHPDLARRWYGQEALDAALGKISNGTKGATADVDLQAENAAVDTNRDPAYNANPDPEKFQGEIQIATNPKNINQVVAASNTWDTTSVCTPTQQIISVVYSADGGVTWQYTCAPGVSAFTPIGLSTCAFDAFGSDPAVWWNDNNEVFLNYMLICNKPTGAKPSMVVARSIDGGANWTAQAVISDGFNAATFNDKNFYVIDNNPGSPFHGRHYTCWDRSNNEKFAYSTNNGVTWTEVDIPEGNNYADVGCDIAVQRNGTVHVIYATYKTSPPKDAKLFYTQSTDGGAHWSAPAQAAQWNLVSFTNTNCPPAQNNRCINPFGSIDVDNSGGPCDGRLYVSFTDYISSVSDTDVYVSSSLDGGATWGTRVRINDVTTGNQFHPFLVMDQDNGYPVVAWHDTRNDGANKAVDFYASRSKDCGATWEANTQVSAASNEFNNNAISTTNLNTASNPIANPNQFGEYLGLDVVSGRAYVSWTDSRQYFPVGGGGNVQRENMAFALVDFGDLFSDGFETSSTSAWSVVGP
ncbi:MAG: sialidase family protein [Thermoanaerobaculia bacterium]